MNIDLHGRSLRLYYGEVLEDSRGRRRRRSPQRDYATILVTRVEGGVETRFLLNTAVFGRKRKNAPSDLVSVYRVIDRGWAMIEDLEKNMLKVCVPDRKGWFVPLLRQGPNWPPGQAMRMDLATDYPEMFLELKPGNLRNEVVRYAMGRTGVITPTSE